MGRKPCCAKEGLKRGSWADWEDKILTCYIYIHGEGKWRDLPQRAGLKRCGKSCRLRWLNYLKPDVKRGNISGAEEDLIIRLHKLLGNKWSLIAGRLPGRTDNEIKNYWNTKLKKRVLQPTDNEIKNYWNTKLKKRVLQPHKKPQEEAEHCNNYKESSARVGISAVGFGSRPTVALHSVIRTKAVKCTKVVIPPFQNDHMVEKIVVPAALDLESPVSLAKQKDDLSNLVLGLDADDSFSLDFLNSDIHQAKEIDRCDDVMQLDNLEEKITMGSSTMESSPARTSAPPPPPPLQAIKTEAVRCTKFVVPQNPNERTVMKTSVASPYDGSPPSSSALQNPDFSNFSMDFGRSDGLLFEFLSSDIHQAEEINECDNVMGLENCPKDMLSFHPHFPDFTHEAKLDDLIHEAILEN